VVAWPMWPSTDRKSSTCVLIHWSLCANGHMEKCGDQGINIGEISLTFWTDGKSFELTASVVILLKVGVTEGWG
jgi:hypothetical protein